MQMPTEDQVRTRAYGLWEQAGKPDGREDEFWYQAEQELSATHELEISAGDAVSNNH
jgi:hypothetical protein